MRRSFVVVLSVFALTRRWLGAQWPYRRSNFEGFVGHDPSNNVRGGPAWVGQVGGAIGGPAGADVCGSGDDGPRGRIDPRRPCAPGGRGSDRRAHRIPASCGTRFSVADVGLLRPASAVSSPPRDPGRGGDRGRRLDPIGGRNGRAQRAICCASAGRL